MGRVRPCHQTLLALNSSSDVDHHVTFIIRIKTRGERTDKKRKTKGGKKAKNTQKRETVGRENQ